MKRNPGQLRRKWTKGSRKVSPKKETEKLAGSFNHAKKYCFLHSGRDLKDILTIGANENRRAITNYRKKKMFHSSTRLTRLGQCLHSHSEVDAKC